MGSAEGRWLGGLHGTLSDLRRGGRTFVAFDVICKVAALVLYAPISAWFLRSILRWSGDRAVSNLDIASFFLSGQGLLLIVVWGTATFAILFFDLGGLALLAVGIQRGERMSVTSTIRHLLARLHRLWGIGLRQFVILAGVTVVFLGVVAASKAMLLSGGDIYYYVRVKPQQLWWFVGIASVTGIATAIATLVLVLRWILAVPLLLVEGTTPRDAMKESRRLVRERGILNVFARVAVWAVAMLLLMFVAGWAHDLLRGALMGIAAERVNLVIAMAGLLLAIDFLLVLLLGMTRSISFASLVARLFNEVRPDAELPESLRADAAAAPEGRRFPLALGVVGVVVVLAGMAVFLSVRIINHIGVKGDVQVTAHRGAAKVTPENTMASINRALEQGADYVEIDVQQSKDGVLVLLHDTDLRRVAGLNRGVWEVAWDEMKELDVGSWFSPEFADQRIPTLPQVLEAVRGRGRVNIEVKSHGHNRELEAETVRAIQAAGMEEDCLVMSLTRPPLEEFKRHGPKIRRGFIVTATLGDPTRIDADFLNVRAALVTRSFVARAHRAGKEVHVWTVNDPGQMLTMIHLGVDNILTSTPDVLVELLREWNEISEAERGLLIITDFLAGRL